MRPYDNVAKKLEMNDIRNVEKQDGINLTFEPDDNNDCS